MIGWERLGMVADWDGRVGGWLGREGWLVGWLDGLLARLVCLHDAGA